MISLTFTILFIASTVGLNLYIIEQRKVASDLYDISQTAAEKPYSAYNLQNKLSKMINSSTISNRPDLVDLKIIIDHHQPSHIIAALIAKIEDESTRISYASNAVESLNKNQLRKYFSNALAAAKLRNERENKGNIIAMTAIKQIRKLSPSPHQALILTDLFELPNNTRIQSVELLSRHNSFVEQAISRRPISEIADIADQYANIGPLEADCVYTWMAKNPTLSDQYLTKLLYHAKHTTNRRFKTIIYDSLLAFNKHLTSDMKQEIKTQTRFRSLRV